MITHPPLKSIHSAAAVLCLGLLATSCSPDSVGATPPPPKPEWRVTAIDRRTLLVQADFSAAEHAAYAPPGRMTDLGDWRWNERFVRAARLAQARRPEIELALTNAANWSVDGLAVARLGFWKSETGLSRFPDTTDKTNVAFAADIVYNVFLTLTADLTNGCTHRIATPAREALDFIRDPQTPSPFIKVNQVGYLPDVRAI